MSDKCFLCRRVNQEVTEVSKRTRTTIDETDASTSQPAAYNAELRDALEKLRGEMDEQLRQSHDETEAFYERKVLYQLLHIPFDFQSWVCLYSHPHIWSRTALLRKHEFSYDVSQINMQQ